MGDLKKPVVKLGNVALAATSGIAWKFVTGTAPYLTTFMVHKKVWNQSLKNQIGEPLQLKITDSRGVTTTINQVYIMHEAPSDSPHRVSFVVADKRWKWSRKLVVRDFNMPRKTGNRTARDPVTPKLEVQSQNVIDEYDYLAYSLKPPQGTRWRARDAVEEVMEVLEGEGTESGGYEIESFPIKDTSGGNNTGEFAIQGVSLRDAGDIALARVLSYIPGTAVYIRADGRAVVFDATDLEATEEHFRELPIDTYAGEKPAWIDRKKIRPKKVIVYYQREVELPLEYEDNFSGQTSAAPVFTRPFIDNVLPTVDPSTDLTVYEPVTGQATTTTVRAGTWVRFDQWLDAMDKDRPDDSLPWTFDAIRIHWVKDDLEGRLASRGVRDTDEEANVAMRVQALRQHFRQTFRINPRYMRRIRSFRAVRAGLLDPVTGTRAPAQVWGQICIIPSQKGKAMIARGAAEDPKARGAYRNVDYLAKSANQNIPLLDTTPGPARLTVLDEELGIFRVEWQQDPYGLTNAIIPSLLVDEQENDNIPRRDYADQDTEPMGSGMRVEAGTNGVFLKKRMEYVGIVTIVPAAPNSERQFHRVEIEPSDIATIFQKEFRIKEGEGPELEVFVPPSEATARFALNDLAEATQTVSKLLALDGSEGLEDNTLPGYVLINEERELKGHSTAIAAEALAAYADNVQGNVVTQLPDGGVKLVGNMTSATIRAAAAPSGKVDLVSQFPGQQRPIPRFALLPDSARQVVLGILPYK